MRAFSFSKAIVLGSVSFLNPVDGREVRNADVIWENDDAPLPVMLRGVGEDIKIFDMPMSPNYCCRIIPARLDCIVYRQLLPELFYAFAGGNYERNVACRPYEGWTWKTQFNVCSKSSVCGRLGCNGSHIYLPPSNELTSLCPTYVSPFWIDNPFYYSWITLSKLLPARVIGSENQTFPLIPIPARRDSVGVFESAIV
jgi:hypothetical protein